MEYGGGRQDGCGGGSMSMLQRLFDRLVGVDYEAALRCEALRVLREPAIRLAALETPACWRRPARILRRR